jgi:hypothetical protein
VACGVELPGLASNTPVASSDSKRQDAKSLDVRAPLDAGLYHVEIDRQSERVVRELWTGGKLGLVNGKIV